MGKGFSVVADEVGKLAEESITTVSGIHGIIEEIKMYLNIYQKIQKEF